MVFGVAMMFGAAIIPLVPSHAAEGPRTPHQIINALQQRIYVIGETSRKYADFAGAEAKAAEEISAFDDNDAPVLTEKDKNGMTPLIKASYLGYADVVEALLKYPSVLGAIEATDPKGGSAWVYANFAIRQSLLACNPAAKENPFALVPIMVTQAYYASKKPYPRIREALTKAGAVSDMEKAKGLWLSICTQQSAETRAKVSGTTDLLETVIQEGAANMKIP